MDLVLKLREIRRMRGLSQKDVARLSGVGEKTISSFETGERIGSLKLAQLARLLAVYGLTEAEFFDGRIEKEIAPWELDENQIATARLLDDLHALPRPVQRNLLSKFQLMVDTVADVRGDAEAELFASAVIDHRQYPRTHTQS
jgi:transcriptional regulator with XRE-family HTH domain